MMPTRATRLITASKMKTLALDDVQGHDGDVYGLQGPTSMWKSKIPLGLGLSRVPPKETSFFLPGANLQFLLTPVGVTTSICGI
jgi:hypothetical protein